MQMKKKQVGPAGPWVTTKSEEPATQQDGRTGRAAESLTAATWLPWNISVEQLESFLSM
jgi:hypothetical protein